MIRVLFKKAFKNRKGRTLLIIEFVLAFVIIFSLSVFSFKSIENYFRPVGFHYENILDIGVGPLEKNSKKNNDSIQNELIIQISNVLKSQPEISGFTLITNFVPFSNPAPTYQVHSGDYKARAFGWKADDRFAEIVQIEMIEGRWFTEADNGRKSPPVVINRELSRKLRLDVGDVVQMNDVEHEVVGIASSFYPNNSRLYEGLFIRNTPGTDYFETAVSFLAKTTVPGINAQLKIKYHDLLGSVLNNHENKNTFVFSLEELRKREWSGSIVIVIILGIIVAFLIVNLLLGLVGVLQQNIVRRTQEIGIRRAVGSTRWSIHRMIIGEMYVLLGFSCIIGCLFTIQFYVFNVFKTSALHYMISMVVSALVLFLLVGLFSLHPSLKAARIEPAVALHNE